MSLLATKPLSRILAESEGGVHTLKRTLGPTSLVALGIGAIIGAGLFSLTGIAAANNAGPAIALSFVIAAIARMVTSIRSPLRLGADDPRNELAHQLARFPGYIDARW